MLNKNCRISYDLFSKMNRVKLTASEILMLLHLVQIQDQFGHCSGVYYNDFKIKYERKGHSYAHRTFYDSLRSLELKKIITYKKTGKGDYDIDILANDFSFENLADMKNSIDANGVHDLRYFKVNVDFFGDEFFRLTPAEMILAMDLYRQCVAARALGDDASGSITFKAENFYTIYSEKLKAYGRKEEGKIQFRTLKTALAKMKKMINVNRVNGLIKIQIKTSTLAKTAHNTLTKMASSWAKVLMRRYKLSTVTTKEMRNMILNGNYNQKKDERNQKKAARDLINTICFLLKKLKKYALDNVVDIEFQTQIFDKIEKVITDYFGTVNNTRNIRKWFDRDWNKHCRIINTRLYDQFAKEL